MANTIAHNTAQFVLFTSSNTWSRLKKSFFYIIFTNKHRRIVAMTPTKNINNHSVRPMTHAPETGAINRRQLYGADFWRVSHAKPVPILSGTRFRRRLEPSAALFQAGFWREMVICDWSLVVVYLFACCSARPGPSCKLVKHTLRCQWQNILSYDTLLLLAFSHLRYVYIMSQKNLNELTFLTRIYCKLFYIKH